MRKINKSLALLITLAMVMTLFAGLTSAQANSVWVYRDADGTTIAIPGSPFSTVTDAVNAAANAFTGTAVTEEKIDIVIGAGTYTEDINLTRLVDGTLNNANQPVVYDEVVVRAAGEAILRNSTINTPVLRIDDVDVNNNPYTWDGIARFMGLTLQQNQLLDTQKRPLIRVLQDDAEVQLKNNTFIQHNAYTIAYQVTGDILVENAAPFHNNTYKVNSHFGFISSFLAPALTESDGDLVLRGDTVEVYPHNIGTHGNVYTHARFNGDQGDMALEIDACNVTVVAPNETVVLHADTQLPVVMLHGCRNVLDNFHIIQGNQAGSAGVWITNHGTLVNNCTIDTAWVGVWVDDSGMANPGTVAVENTVINGSKDVGAYVYSDVPGSDATFRFRNVSITNNKDATTPGGLPIAGLEVCIDDDFVTAGDTNIRVNVFDSTFTQVNRNEVAILVNPPYKTTPNIFNLLRNTYVGLPGLGVRHGGADRYETAIAVAKANWNRADNVVIARADLPYDALSAAPLARALDAPILLTQSNVLRDDIRKAIEDLNATNVIIVGGEQAVSRAVADSLGAIANVQRIAGATRYETSVRIAERLLTLWGQQSLTNTAGAAVMVTGENFPDALAAAPLTYGVDAAPILLTAPNQIPEVVKGFLNDKKPAVITADNFLTIVGGTAAVSEVVRDHARVILGGPNTTNRIGGDDRYHTAQLVANSVAGGSLVDTKLIFARGDDLGGGADALSAGALGARLNSLATGGYDSSVILLTRPDAVPVPVANYLRAQNDNIMIFGDNNRNMHTAMVLMGGPAAISEAVRQDLSSAVFGGVHSAAPVAPPVDLIRSFSTAPGLSPGKTLVIVELNVTDPQNYSVAVAGQALNFDATNQRFFGEVNTPDATRANVVVTEITVGMPDFSFNAADGLSPGKKLVIVELDTATPDAYKVTVAGVELTFSAENQRFFGEVNTADAVEANVVVSQK